MPRNPYHSDRSIVELILLVAIMLTKFNNESEKINQHFVQTHKSSKSNKRV
jgi:hypothetical protein